MNTLFESMLDAYLRKENVVQGNAEREVMQLVVLSGLNRGGFFRKAAFYGGTCLRIFHDLPRFSEDMDFSLLEPDPDFSFEEYFPAILEECKFLGRRVTITKKDKRTLGHVESAFLKDNTSVYNLAFQTEKTLKIKIEVDTQPPLGFETEQLLLHQPHPSYIRCVALPDLFAGKMHALLFRRWRRRIKGRDWYDFDWYVRHSVPLDFNHLRERIKNLDDVDLDRESFMTLLKEKLSSCDIDDVKSDVLPYISDPRDLEIWSTDYFLQLADSIRLV